MMTKRAKPNARALGPMPRCECPTKQTERCFSDSWYLPQEVKCYPHEPNQCPGDYNVFLYDRDGERLYLCSTCNMGYDIRLDIERAIEVTMGPNQEVGR